MKNRVNKILLAALVVTSALNVPLLLNWLEITPTPVLPGVFYRFTALWVYLILAIHIAPFFCLQLLVCRTAKSPVLRLLPVFLLVGLIALLMVLFFSFGLFGVLIGAFMLCLCFIPAIGYALAWAAYGIGLYLKSSHKQADLKGKQPDWD